MSSSGRRQRAGSAADSGQEYSSDPQYTGGQESSSSGQQYAASGPEYQQSGQGQQGASAGAYQQSQRGAGTATYAQPRSGQEARYAEEGRYAEEDRRAGAAAGAMLAGVLMIISGLYAFLVGLTGIIRGSFYHLSSTYTYHWTVRGWGITEVVLGAVIAFAGVCLLLGMMWARVVGIVLASFNAISAFIFLPWYPISSIILVALNVFIIWAIAHYRPLREAI
jgi:hypothetical protein